MSCRTALPLLLSLRYQAYWYCNYGDYIDTVALLLRRNVRLELRCPEP